MSEARLSEMNIDTKRSLIRQVGFETQQLSNRRGWRLIDKKCNAEQFIDNDFRNIDDILQLISGELQRKGFMICR